MEINIILSILINDKICYQSESKKLVLVAGDNPIEITLKKISSDETETDKTETTESEYKTDGTETEDTTGGQTSSDTGFIKLTTQEEKSNTSITVTVNVTGNKNIQKVSYIKGEVEKENLESVFSDENAHSAEKDTENNSKWTFKINAISEEANDIYTVVAMYSSSNILSETITINNFDFTAPSAIDESSITGTYDKSANKISLSWQNPTDEDFEHVKITYTSTKQGTESSSSEAENVTGDSKEFTDIDSENSYYTFSLVTVDTTGNESFAIEHKVTVNSFVKIDEKTIFGSETWTPESCIFIANRSLTISSFYICDHEVTKAEFKEIMGTDPSETETTTVTAENNPVTDVNWYATIAYCNKLSVSEGLVPCYTVSSVNDWASFEYSNIPTSSDSTWDAATCDFTKNGYRLPTEAEWEYAARGNQDFTYAGSDTSDDTTWHSGNSESSIHEVKTKKANGYGLYDMCGNASEWCWDWYAEITTSTDAEGATSGTTRAHHGGSWYKSESNCDVSARFNTYPYHSDDEIGFRIVRTAQ